MAHQDNSFSFYLAMQGLDYIANEELWTKAQLIEFLPEVTESYAIDRILFIERAEDGRMNAEDVTEQILESLADKIVDNIKRFVRHDELYFERCYHNTFYEGPLGHKVADALFDLYPSFAQGSDY